ncbi:MAG: hypothetical protein D3923_06125 [Candidatus Electrothrix sp. AR3]|nr:hypothetical protein [Candidatus Electrothrix sp. AR3]
MKNIVLAASIFLGCMYFSSAWAVDLTLFEHDFLRNKGKKDVYEETVIAHEGEARLIISTLVTITY